MAYQVNDSMDISDATIAMSRTQIVNYQQAVRDDMAEVKDAVRDYKIIVDAVSKVWNGAAAQKFVNNLHTSTEKACDALDAIGNAMDALFQVIKTGMIKQDNEMIEDGDIPF